MSYCPARMAPAASISAAPPLAQPASTSTIGMPVSAERAEHLVARGDAAVGGAAERGLERAGCPPRRAPRAPRATPMSVTAVSVEAAERVEADAGDRRRRIGSRRRRERVGDDVGAVVVGVQDVGDEVHRLSERRDCAGSASVSRVMTRSPSSTQLDDAEAERHGAVVARRRGGDRGPAPRASRRPDSCDAPRRRRAPEYGHAGRRGKWNWPLVGE